MTQSVGAHVWDKSQMEPSQVARAVERRMKALGLNPKSLSRKANLNETFVRDLIKGRSRNPRADSLQKLAKSLDCTVGELTGDQPNARAAADPAFLLRRLIMDVEVTARVYAIELLTTQLISEYLRTVPEPAKQAVWARNLLQRTAETMPIRADGFDEEARLRVSIKNDIARIIGDALARAQTTPLRPPSWDMGSPAG